MHSHHSPSASRVLVIGAGDWMATALRAVLEPEGFTIQSVPDLSALRAALDAEAPRIAIVAGSYPDHTTADLARMVGDRVEGLPILVCGDAAWNEADEDAVLRAGAWELLRAPVRTGPLIERLRELVGLSQLMENRAAPPLTAERPFLELRELLQSMELMRGIAARSGQPVGIAALGPSGGPPGLGWSRFAESLVSAATRASDVGAWLGNGDFAISAYGADETGMTALVDRLRTRVAGEWEGAGLSAGIARLEPESPSPGSTDRSTMRRNERLRSASVLAASREALHRARRAGGGVLKTEGS